MRSLLWLSLLLAAQLELPAQEVAFGVGRLHELGAKETTYSWQFQYLQYFNESWAGSFTWLNEGHLSDHHRDGAALQGWHFHRMENNALRLGAGLGLYRYFDTTSQDQADGYRNNHGIKPILSLRGQYPWPSGAWSTFAQLNRVFGPDGPQTQGILIGVSTRFAPAPAGEKRATRGTSVEDTDNELDFMFGRTILNSFESEASDFLSSYAVDYRRRVADHLDLTVGYCDEGGIDSAKRDGLVAQGWVTTRPSHGDWLLGAGFGPYCYRDFPDQKSSSAGTSIRTSMRYSMIVGHHLWAHWSGRLQWNRTLTHYQRDTDVLLAGLAYQW